MTYMNFSIGPNETEVRLLIDVQKGEKTQWYDSNSDGYPGSDPTIEILEAKVHENKSYRELTDEENEWLQEAEEQIEKEFFAFA